MISARRSDLVEEVEFLARFRREAQAVANLRHENIVQVYDFDARLPARISDPDFTTISPTPGVSVLSGDDCQSITDIPLVDDKTDHDAVSGRSIWERVLDELASETQASPGKAFAGEVLETFSSGGVSARGERKDELTERSGHYFVRIAVLALVIVVAVASLPLGGRG